MSNTHRPFPLPSGPWVSHQRWNKLCFIHWEVDESRLRRLIPPELDLDSFEGKSYVGVVPFEMANVRPRFLPSLGRYSTFPELNVRVYVKHKGVPGVYFLSLDAGRKFFVWGGRTFFCLPYFFASMTMTTGEVISYSSLRDQTDIQFKAQYKPKGAPFSSQPGSLEEFLTERYCLFVIKKGQVAICHIDHSKWTLQEAELEIQENTLLAGLDLDLIGDPLIQYSEALEVRIWPLRYF